MAIKEDKTRIIITIEKDVKEILDGMAKEVNRSTSNFVVNLIKEYIRTHK